MGRWVMGQWITWVAMIIRWVTWVMGQWVLTHDPSIFRWAACGDCFCCIMFKSNKTCDLSVMKSCVFSLFTFQMASQFPKRDNDSADHVWFFVCFISDLSLSQWITNTFWQHHRECSTMGHGSYGSWVKYSVGHMGHGSLEVTHRLPCFSLQSHNRTVIPTTYICIYIHFAITTSFMLALIDCVGSRSLSFRVYFGACTERQTWSLVLGRARCDNARWYWLPADHWSVLDVRPYSSQLQLLLCVMHFPLDVVFCSQVSETTNCGHYMKRQVSNESIRAQAQLQKIDLIIKKRRLRWLGHVLRMDDNRLPRQAVHWDISGTMRKPARQERTGSTLYNNIWKASAWPGKTSATARCQQRRLASACGHVSLTRDELKVKFWTLVIAPLTRVRLVTSSALQSRKWQLIGMSQCCRSALCGHPLPALTDNWTHGAASRHAIAPISHTICLHPVAIATTHFPSHWR